MVSVTNLAEAAAEGRSVIVDENPRTVRLDLAAGDAVPPHDHPGEDVVFHVLEGAVALSLDDETYDLEAGDVCRFPGERSVSPEATTDAVALVVLAERAD
jgi:quercetin dioxygenase-like cupin family protein